MMKSFSKIIKSVFVLSFLFCIYNFSFIQNINAECGSPEDNNCYTLLESITGGEGGVDEITIQADGLGAYLEMIMSYLLVLVTIAAVFYLIYGGVLYLTTDIINQKKEGKEVITRVIVGLIFVFSVWTIMNSINSGLLKSSLDFSLKKIGVTVGSAVSTTLSTIAGGGSASTTPSKPSNPITGCAAGLETVQGGYQLCGSVAGSMKSLISAAANDGVNLSVVSAYRSQNSSAVAGGGTAAANGKSMHQVGLAVDFSGFKNGPENDSRFVWLQNNASKYGFYNVLYKTKSDEYNHWSTTGR